METYNEIPKQPDTAYETSELHQYLKALSESERHVLRMDASSKFEELGVFIEAIDRITNADPNQYEIDLGAGDGEV